MHHSICHKEVSAIRKEMVLLKAMGYTYREIGKQVFLSERTIDGNFYKMRKQFNCKSDAQLVAEFFRFKIIE